MKQITLKKVNEYSYNVLSKRMQEHLRDAHIAGYPPYHIMKKKKLNIFMVAGREMANYELSVETTNPIHFIQVMMSKGANAIFMKDADIYIWDK